VKKSLSACFERDARPSRHRTFCDKPASRQSVNASATFKRAGDLLCGICHGHIASSWFPWQSGIKVFDSTLRADHTSNSTRKKVLEHD
jgi:hypothetical protein